MEAGEQIPTREKRLLNEEGQKILRKINMEEDKLRESGVAGEIESFPGVYIGFSAEERVTVEKAKEEFHKKSDPDQEGISESERQRMLAREATLAEHGINISERKGISIPNSATRVSYATGQKGDTYYVEVQNYDNSSQKPSTTVGENLIYAPTPDKFGEYIIDTYQDRLQ